MDLTTSKLGAPIVSMETSEVVKRTNKKILSVTVKTDHGVIPIIWKEPLQTIRKKSWIQWKTEQSYKGSLHRLGDRYEQESWRNVMLLIRNTTPDHSKIQICIHPVETS